MTKKMLGRRMKKPLTNVLTIRMLRKEEKKAGVPTLNLRLSPKTRKIYNKSRGEGEGYIRRKNKRDTVIQTERGRIRGGNPKSENKIYGHAV